ncbi:lytic transglycosylase domain-containing protein [Brevibacillus laterosporus]|uniref:Lytic transglycosylase n=1 Tax=Brevibacillus laterosporus TaxID=1465 RepID=A0AAP3DJW1_BRELA|nr:lytic transglycosylase domain-containing protein [Brevibacillus laterosporus]MCR8981260.1 lytic transglycosylase domain-containing protein [Brevibacillus laterosporus]MCZ0808415.1 lytic transglycosylase domain-containing protein [Brevibacillus laterosporus]MCZ0826868.1 lytic transglycosylase domain-containing protein [Brevibacillus laterosporus]MCZ0850585.1 lytic transglycosylase domain-containing protein [Brevibacillus laterosporus]MED1666326.1 lytic transglycosylase domain-containing prot
MDDLIVKIDSNQFVRNLASNGQWASGDVSQVAQIQELLDNQANSNGQDPLFSDVFDSELQKYQHVISKEQVLAELDGTKQQDNWNSSMNYSSTSPDLSFSRGESMTWSRQQIVDKIEQVSKRFGVNSDLVKEVVRAESNFNPVATSHAGAKGLMQLMDDTARSVGVRNSYDPDQNLTGGTQYLGKLLDRYDGNVKVALAAYNAGSGRVRRAGIETDEDFDRLVANLPQETQRYVAKITTKLQAED